MPGKISGTEITKIQGSPNSTIKQNQLLGEPDVQLIKTDGDEKKGDIKDPKRSKKFFPSFHSRTFIVTSYHEYQRCLPLSLERTLAV